MKILAASAAVLVLAAVMTMTGRGGGNFYVIVQVLAGRSMHEAAATGQLVMFATALAAMLVFQKQRIVVWPMAAFIGLTTSLMALAGGMAAYRFSTAALELVFAVMLALAGLLMLVPAAEREKAPGKGRPGYWRIRWGGDEYRVNLWLALPVCLGTGVVAGMVGVSGGSFLVPLMVLACGLPMRAAVGTASVMVAATAMMGFLGHLSRGGVDVAWALPQAAAGVVGGLVGGRLALKARPAALKKIFAATTLAAAVFMLVKALS